MYWVFDANLSCHNYPRIETCNRENISLKIIITFLVLMIKTKQSRPHWISIKKSFQSAVMPPATNYHNPVMNLPILALSMKINIHEFLTGWNNNSLNSLNITCFYDFKIQGYIKSLNFHIVVLIISQLTF